MRTKSTIIYSTMIILVSLWILPIWPTVLLAFKNNQEFALQKFWEFPSQNFFGPNLIKAWNQANLGRYFMNSLFYGLIGAWGAIFLSSMAAFSIARLRVRGSLSSGAVPSFPSRYISSLFSKCTFLQDSMTLFGA